jgi:hypothetical protein
MMECSHGCNVISELERQFVDKGPWGALTEKTQKERGFSQ